MRARAGQKTKARQEDVALRVEMAEELESTDFGKDSARSIADWDPYNQNTSAEWFDPEWMFGISEGFDVTIGNPPYVRADFQSERNKAVREAIKRGGDYETLQHKWDVYVAFMERGFKLLAPGGVASLIVSDAFCKEKYASKSRKWFLRNALIERVDFYSEIKLFDAAVHNISYIFQKSEGLSNVPNRRLHSAEFGHVVQLDTNKQADLDERAFRYQDTSWAPTSVVVRLGNICYISRGMSVHAHEKESVRTHLD